MTINAPLKWHGGKSYLASRIIDLLPPRDTWHLWREPFFGGGAVTLALDPEGLSEAVNDIDGKLMNFWRVLRDTPDRMLRALWATPLSQDMFAESGNYMRHDDAVRRATAFFIRCRQSRQGLMKDFATPTRRVRRGMNENVSAWLSAVDGLPEVHERLRRIEIRNMDAVEFIQKYDDPQAVFMCDPPYVHSTRSTGGGEYSHEMTDTQHVCLLENLSCIQGRFVLCGYRNSIYDSHSKMCGWNRKDFPIDNKASSKRLKQKVIESVWMNY